MSEFSTILRLVNDKAYYTEMSSKYNETDLLKLCNIIDGEYFPFIRDFVKDIEKAILNSPITFLVGPRRCGKTVGLHQLCTTHTNTVYKNVKGLSSVEAAIFVKEVCSDIVKGTSINYLIDEFTYFRQMEPVLTDIATALASNPKTSTKLVITGSQQQTLEYFKKLVFSSTAARVEVDFLSYSEWLHYSSENPSKDSYVDYLMDLEEFYDAPDALEYIKGSLLETVVSNVNTLCKVPDNDIKNLSEHYVLDVLFALLVHLHNPIKWETLTKKSSLKDKLVYEYATTPEEDRLLDILQNRYTRFKGSSVDDFKACLKFLYACKLITLTVKSDAFTYVKPLTIIDNCTSKEEILSKVNPCVRHPFFFMSLVHYAYGEKLLPTQSILGSIVECHARAYLPSDYCFEYKDDSAEVDYVYTDPCVAVEFTVSKKHANHSNVLPANYKFTMLSDKTFPQSIVSIEQDAISFLNSIYGKE